LGTAGKGLVVNAETGARRGTQRYCLLVEELGHDLQLNILPFSALVSIKYRVQFIGIHIGEPGKMRETSCNRKGRSDNRMSYIASIYAKSVIKLVVRSLL
jgi:hypothetical protein